MEELRPATRVGLIVPSSNTVLEPELARLAARTGGVDLHATRVRVARIGLDTAAAAQFAPEAMLDAARLLADAGVDVLVWGGTSGSWLGIDADRLLVAGMERELGVPATTSTLTLLDACRSSGARSVALLTPYTADVAARITTCYRAEGVEVVAEAHLGLSDNRSFAAAGPDELAALAQSVDLERAEAILVVCTNLGGGSLATRLRPDCHLPVLDSVEATLWGALRRTGPLASGTGSLLEASSRSAATPAKQARDAGETTAQSYPGTVPRTRIGVEHAGEVLRG